MFREMDLRWDLAEMEKARMTIRAFMKHVVPSPNYADRITLTASASSSRRGSSSRQRAFQ